MMRRREIYNEDDGGIRNVRFPDILTSFLPPSPYAPSLCLHILRMEIEWGREGRA